MRIEIVGGNRKGVTVSCFRHLCFREEKKMFSEGEVVFYRLKIKLKTANVAEVDRKNVKGVSRHLGSLSEEQSDLGTFTVPFPEGDYEAGVGVAIFG